MLRSVLIIVSLPLSLYLLFRISNARFTSAYFETDSGDIDTVRAVISADSRLEFETDTGDVNLGKFDTARAHLELSHKFGNARAAYALGCLLEFERLDASERERAYELYKEAEKGGFYDNRSSFKLKILKMIKRA